VQGLPTPEQEEVLSILISRPASRRQGMEGRSPDRQNYECRR